MRNSTYTHFLERHQQNKKPSLLSVTVLRECLFYKILLLMDSIQRLLEARKPFDIAIEEVKKQQSINSQMYNALMFALEIIYPEYDGSFQAIQKAIQENTHIVYKIGAEKELRVMDTATNKSQPLMKFIKSQNL